MNRRNYPVASTRNLLLFFLFVMLFAASFCALKVRAAERGRVLVPGAGERPAHSA